LVNKMHILQFCIAYKSPSPNYQYTVIQIENNIN